jgi:hypothetical protein
VVFGGQRLVRGHEIRQEPIDNVRDLCIGLLNGLPGRVPGTAKQVHADDLGYVQHRNEEGQVKKTLR